MVEGVRYTTGYDGRGRCRSKVGEIWHMCHMYLHLVVAGKFALGYDIGLTIMFKRITPQNPWGHLQSDISN